MFKLLRRLICLAIIAAIVFIVLSVTGGGQKIRWFGKQVEQQSEKAGKEADKLKENTDKVMTGIERAKEKVTDLTDKKSGKSD